MIEQLTAYKKRRFKMSDYNNRLRCTCKYTKSHVHRVSFDETKWLAEFCDHSAANQEHVRHQHIFCRSCTSFCSFLKY